MLKELSNKARNIKPSTTMEITEKAKALKQRGKDIISFTAGEPDFATPDNICDAAVTAIHEGQTKYTQATGLTELKEAISKKFKDFNHLDYSVDQIVVSNGGKHSLSNVFTALFNEGDEVIILAPYWVTYTESARLQGAKPVIVYTKKENGYQPTREELEEVCTDKTKAVIINTPNNPTGAVYSREILEIIADFAVAHNLYVVSDEVYEYLTYEGREAISIASLNEEIYKRTITVSGLSKSYAMTGWRIGYTGAPKEITKVMSAIQSQQTSNPNTIAQMASIEALSGDQLAIEKMRAEYNARRKYIVQRIRQVEGLSCMEPMGAFYVFVDVSEFLEKQYHGKPIKDAADFAKYLLEDLHVGVIPCADFGFPEHIRLSYSISLDAIRKGMDRLEEFSSQIL